MLLSGGLGAWAAGRSALPRTRAASLGDNFTRGVALGEVMAVDGHFEGFLGLASGVVEDLESLEEALPVKWHTAFVVVNALCLSAFVDDSEQELLEWFDIHEAAGSVQAVRDGVLAFRSTRRCRSSVVLLNAGSESLAAVWVEIIYQARAMRKHWSLTRFGRLERALCCCLCCTRGTHVLDHMRSFAGVNAFFVLVDLAPVVTDLAEPQPALRLLNGLFTLIGLGAYVALVSRRRRPMRFMLRSSLRLCLALSALCAVDVVLGVWAALREGAEGDEGAAARGGVLGAMDLTSLALWLNGAYLSAWGRATLKQDISGALVR